MYVTKFDGRKQKFQKSKIIRTCTRMHASEKIAKEIADKIESEAYDGISTKKILRMIFKEIKKYKPEIAYQIDLRKAISLLRPKPDFEKFISELLKAHGYKVESNRIVRGKCVEHEIDAIAEKGKGKKREALYVEVKHHFKPHTYTGMSIVLETQARFEDMLAGYKAGKTKVKFTKPLVLCNTKFSDHAKRYADCIGIDLIGWKAPEERGLEQLVEEKKLYPITFLKSLGKKNEAKLGDTGIVLLRQFVRRDVEWLNKKTGIGKDKLKRLMKGAEEILSGK